MNNQTWTTSTTSLPQSGTYKEVDYTKQALRVLKITHQSGALRYKTLANFIALVEISAEELKKI